MPKIAEKALQLLRNQMNVDGLNKLGYCKIMVLGIGGAGNNTIGRLMEEKKYTAECIAINTDIQHLRTVNADKKVLIGEKLTRGLGSGGDPNVGKSAIEESAEQIREILEGADLVFVTAGLGGGTGTGAGPIVSKIARESGAIVFGVVTMPFQIERGRISIAIKGLTEMIRECNTIVVIDNNKLVKVVPQLPINEAFKVADKILANMIGGITEIISLPSLINLDFEDFRTIINKGGVSVVGLGESSSPNRVEEAVKEVLNMPLLDVDYVGAKGALIHVTGDEHMTIDEANRTGEIISQTMSDDAMVIWGARVDPRLLGSIKLTVVLTGVQSHYSLLRYPSMFPNIYQLDPSENITEDSSLDLGIYRL